MTVFYDRSLRPLVCFLSSFRLQLKTNLIYYYRSLLARACRRLSLSLYRLSHQTQRTQQLKEGILKASASSLVPQSVNAHMPVHAVPLASNAVLVRFCIASRRSDTDGRSKPSPPSVHAFLPSLRVSLSVTLPLTDTINPRALTLLYSF